MGSTEALGFENGRKVFDVLVELEAARDQWCTSGFGALCQRAHDEITELRADAERYRYLRDRAGNAILHTLMYEARARLWDTIVDTARAEKRT